METLVKFKSFICKYEDFDRVELEYPNDQSKPICVEVYFKDGRKTTIFAAQNILTCWLFMESMELINPKEKILNGKDLGIESLPIFDKEGKIREHLDAIKEEAILQQMNKMCENIVPGALAHQAFYCCNQKLEFLKDVAIGRKWHCKVCDERYDTQDIALRKNVKKGSQ